jgi:hypothetical protein
MGHCLRVNTAIDPPPNQSRASRARAIELLALVEPHPAVEHETKVHTKRLLSERVAEVPDGIVKASQEGGRRLHLEAVVKEI